MCVFCAAIPTTLTLGSVAEARQREAQRLGAAQASPRPKRIPALALAGLAAAGLLAGSVLYHTGRLS
ncbi:MAG TPA: hypothetical protein VK449_02705 [Anaerolineales bacterium]|nr:hypothetical protein [Anaerolineales bacterium]